MMDWNNGGWVVMAVLMALFWAGIIGAAILVVRPPRQDHVPGRGEPENVLAERLARGEIDDDEYRRIRSVLDERR